MKQGLVFLQLFLGPLSLRPGPCSGWTKPMPVKGGRGKWICISWWTIKSPWNMLKLPAFLISSSHWQMKEREQLLRRLALCMAQDWSVIVLIFQISRVVRIFPGFKGKSVTGCAWSLWWMGTQDSKRIWGLFVTFHRPFDNLLFQFFSPWKEMNTCIRFFPWFILIIAHRSHTV